MPHTTDWRESVSALDDVYMFQADLYCEDCGRDIQAKLRKEGKAPEDEDDEESFDSDDFPKGPYGEGGGEADGPHHCGSNEGCLNAIKLPCGSKIGAWLGNPLTNDGIEWLSNTILEDLLTPRIDKTLDRLSSQRRLQSESHSQQVGRLWSYLYRVQLSGTDHLIQVEGKALTAPIVKSFCQLVEERGREPYWLDPWGLWVQQHALYINRAMIDLDNIYGFSATKSTMWIWKSEIQPNGQVGKPTEIQLPLGVAGETEPLNILLELIEEGAWD